MVHLDLFTNNNSYLILPCHLQNSPLHLLNMNPSNEMVPSIGGHRDRSYSDNANPSTATIDEAAPASNKMTTAKKQQCHHHHGNNRPRSKSCDLTVHKKKYPTVHKYIPDASHSPIAHQYYGGRNSPSSCKLRGKMWIRPVAVRGPASFMPPGANEAPSPTAKERRRRVEGDEGVGNVSASSFSFSPLHSPVRRGTQSPEDDVMMEYEVSSPSSFDCSYYEHRVGSGSPKSTRIIFGESGKPIKPRIAFEPHLVTPTIL